MCYSMLNSMCNEECNKGKPCFENRNAAKKQKKIMSDHRDGITRKKATISQTVVKCFNVISDCKKNVLRVSQLALFRTTRP